MPHLHTQPGQHDMTISAFIVRREGESWKCLVHMHKKIGKLMQIGGHIELNETPWQSVVHELEEESGYVLDELDILQPFSDTLQHRGSIVHPVPFTSTTHNVGDEHFHSDLCYGFIAKSKPVHTVLRGESDDLRWYTLDELVELARRDKVLQDVVDIYTFLLVHIDTLVGVSTAQFSTGKLTTSNASYLFGKPSEGRRE